MRRAGVVTTAVVLALALTACGGSDGGSAERDRPPRVEPSPSGPTTDASAYVGLTEDAAIARAEAEDRPWRILREDDEFFPATMDYVEERVNFEIDDGEVTKATFG